MYILSQEKRDSLSTTSNDSLKDCRRYWEMHGCGKTTSTCTKKGWINNKKYFMDQIRYDFMKWNPKTGQIELFKTSKILVGWWQVILTSTIFGCWWVWWHFEIHFNGWCGEVFKSTMFVLIRCVVRFWYSQY